LIGRHTYILWMGNQIAGSEMNQKRKKHIKSRVLIPALSGRRLAVDIKSIRNVHVRRTKKTYEYHTR